MPVEIKVRDSEKDDATFLYKWLLSPSSRLSYMPENELEAEISTSMWMAFCPLKCSLTAVAEGEPIAMVTLQLAPFQKIKHNAECSIIVSPEYQRTGVGTVLMEEFFKMCKERFSMEFIYLHVYQGSGSINFYKKMGFTKFATQKKWIKDQSTGKYRERIFMEKTL